jgi:hypothetical protein
MDKFEDGRKGPDQFRVTLPRGNWFLACSTMMRPAKLGSAPSMVCQFFPACDGRGVLMFSHPRAC